MTPRWFTVPALIAMATLVADGAQQDATFRARNDTVRVDVLVSKDGQPVTGLKVDDFDVLDNGVRQHLEYSSSDETSINAILALDMSASVAGKELDRLRTAGHALLAALRPTDQAALVTFSQVVALRAPLSSDVSKIGTALDVVRGNGDTSLVDGVYASLVLGESDLNRSLVLVFTDGVDSSSWLQETAAFDTAKRSAAVVYGVAPGMPPKATFLHDLTKMTGGRLITDRTADLSRTFVDVLNEFRHRYLLGYSPQGVSRTGYHTLQVLVRGGKDKTISVSVRPGYLVGS